MTFRNAPPLMTRGQQSAGGAQNTKAMNRLRFSPSRLVWTQLYFPYIFMFYLIQFSLLTYHGYYSYLILVCLLLPSVLSVPALDIWMLVFHVRLLQVGQRSSADRFREHVRGYYYPKQQQQQAWAYASRNMPSILPRKCDLLMLTPPPPCLSSSSMLHLRARGYKRDCCCCSM
ncbi:hypothetical protein DAI22_08g210900 [Oryza sativa Japonica Group]|nr:hypothetical protein DAI22_08g210900 [Oryza sativa Japonica Group]